MMGPGFGDHVAKSIFVLIVVAAIVALACGVGLTLLVQWLWAHLDLSVAWR